MSRDQRVEMKLEFNQYIRAEEYVMKLIASLKTGSLEWANSIELLDRVSRQKVELQTQLNAK